MLDRQFFLDTLPELISPLSTETKALWGIMTPQHMVEHLVGSWRISNGRAKSPLFTPADQLQAMRDFLFGPDQFARLTKNPILPPDGLAKLRKPDLASAKNQLLDDVQTFFAYYDANPDAISTHPIFGDLDYQGWMTFQDKHMRHHLTQFGMTVPT